MAGYPDKYLPRFLASALKLLTGLCVLAALPAYADEAPALPQLDDSHWVDIDHYKPPQDDMAPPATASNDGVKPAVDVTARSPSPAGTAVDADAPDVLTATVALPTRPLDPPEMPGVNKGYHIKIDSTSDTSDTPATSMPIKNIASDPEINLPDHAWRSAIDEANKSMSADAADARAAGIAVRMALLPSPRITPIPSALQASSHSRAALLKAQMTPVPPPIAAGAGKSPQNAEQLAACAVVDAYKKQQLQAIQSDRETLAALQAAIAQMGLQKQLSFLTDPHSQIDKPAADAIPAANGASPDSGAPAPHTTN